MDYFLSKRSRLLLKRLVNRNLSSFQPPPSQSFGIAIYLCFPPRLTAVVRVAQSPWFPIGKQSRENLQDAYGIFALMDSAHFEPILIMQAIHRGVMAEPGKPTCFQFFQDARAMLEQFR